MRALLERLGALVEEDDEPGHRPYLKGGPVSYVLKEHGPVVNVYVLIPNRGDLPDDAQHHIFKDDRTKLLLGGVSTHDLTGVQRSRCARLVRRLAGRGYGPAHAAQAFGPTVPVVEVKSSILEPEHRGVGTGREMYERAIEKMRDRHPAGFYLVNNRCGTGSTSESAARVWASLARRYPHEMAGDKAVLWIGGAP